MKSTLKRTVASFLAALSLMSVGFASAESTHTAEYTDTVTYQENGATYTMTTEVLATDAKAGAKLGVYSTEDFSGKVTEGVGVTASAKASVTGASETASIEKGNAKVEAEYDLGVVTTEASITAGAWKTTKTDGTTEVGYGVKSKLEAEVKVASVEVDGKYGTKDYNVKVGANADALTAGAKAEGTVGYVNGKVVVSGKASAEADVAKVTGKVGGTVGGVEMSVGGSLKVGAGAHAQVGYKDGKVSVDVGAALGVGVDIKFDVDVAAAAEKVADGASYVADKVADGAKTVVNSVANGAKAAWNWLTNW